MHSYDRQVSALSWAYTEKQSNTSNTPCDVCETSWERKCHHVLHSWLLAFNQIFHWIWRTVALWNLIDCMFYSSFSVIPLRPLTCRCAGTPGCQSPLNTFVDSTKFKLILIFEGVLNSGSMVAIVMTECGGMFLFFLYCKSSRLVNWSSMQRHPWTFR